MIIICLFIFMFLFLAAIVFTLLCFLVLILMLEVYPKLNVKLHSDAQQTAICHGTAEHLLGPRCALALFYRVAGGVLPEGLRLQL